MGSQQLGTAAGITIIVGVLLLVGGLASLAAAVALAISLLIAGIIVSGLGFYMRSLAMTPQESARPRPESVAPVAPPSGRKPVAPPSAEQKARVARMSGASELPTVEPAKKKDA